MRKTEGVTWVVYETAGRRGEVRSVCEQGEWDELEKHRPGQHALVKKGIASEADAEALARARVVAVEVAKAEEKKRARRT